MPCSRARHSKTSTISDRKLSSSEITKNANSNTEARTEGELKSAERFIALKKTHQVTKNYMDHVKMNLQLDLYIRSTLTQKVYF